MSGFIGRSKRSLAFWWVPAGWRKRWQQEGHRVLRAAAADEAMDCPRPMPLATIERARASEGVGMSSPTIVVRDDDSPVLEQRGRRRAR
jgi:hypothetical protein